jgi:hypothetical protein
VPYSVSIKSPVVDPLSRSHAEASSRRPRAPSRALTPVTMTMTTRLHWRRRPRLQDGSDDKLSCDPATTTTTFPGQPVCAPAASWNSAGRRRRGPPAVPRRADRAAQAAPTCGRTTADASSCLPRRARSAVRDVSSPAFLAIYTGFYHHRQSSRLVPAHFQKGLVTI